MTVIKTKYDEVCPIFRKQFHELLYAYLGEETQLGSGLSSSDLNTPLNKVNLIIT